MWTSLIFWATLKHVISILALCSISVNNSFPLQWAGLSLTLRLVFVKFIDTQWWHKKILKNALFFFFLHFNGLHFVTIKKFKMFLACHPVSEHLLFGEQISSQTPVRGERWQGMMMKLVFVFYQRGIERKKFDSEGGESGCVCVCHS